MINFFLIVLYSIAVTFGVFVICLVLDYNLLSISLSDKGPLLGAFGIIISAFIASLSVLKNIENTNRIEEKRVNRKIKSLIHSLALVLQRLNILDTLIKKTESSFKEDKNKVVLFYYKTHFPYLVSIRNSIINEDYSAYIKDTDNYLLLLEIIGSIDDSDGVLSVVKEIDIKENDELTDKIKTSIVKLRADCKILINFYKNKSSILIDNKKDEND